MKVLLINPPFNRLKRVFMPYISLGLQYLSAFLKKNDFPTYIYNGDGPDPYIKPVTPLLRDRFNGQDNYKSALSDDNHYVWQEIRNLIREEKPEVVGITATTPVYPSALKVAEIVKAVDPRIIIILGGIHATLNPSEPLSDENIDFVICGEGEKTFLSLVSVLEHNTRTQTQMTYADIDGLAYKRNGKPLINTARNFIDDVDILPIPDRDSVINHFPNNGDKRAIVTMRGCAYDCLYCNSPQLWKRTVRMRSVNSVLQEMTLLYKNYGVRLFEFKDETFTISRKRVEEFCQKIIDGKYPWSWSCTTRIDLVDKDLIVLMARAGCVHMTFGIESGSDTVLSGLNKRIEVSNIEYIAQEVKNNGILLNINVMVGLPNETSEDIEKTKALIEKIKPHRIFVGSYVPLPDSELQKQYHSKTISPAEWSNYSFHSWHNYFNCGSIPKEEFLKSLAELVDIADAYNKNRYREYLLLLKRKIKKLTNIM